MKKIDDIKTFAVVGAGTMGSGIAQIAAMAGLKVILYDLSDEILKESKQKIIKNLEGAVTREKITGAQKDKAINLIQLTNEFGHIKADFIIEAIVEDLRIKVDVFQKLTEQNEAQAILASNTSSIPITQIGRSIANPERVVGMHFFNPVHIMKLVEVISGAATAPEVVETTKLLAEKFEKKAVIAKDAPGFIVNRVARHYYGESLKILEENIADHETIDSLMEASGFRMGPFKLMDLIGIDTNFAVTSSMFDSFYKDPKFRPNRIQQQKVDAGHHGRKTGQGFYRYD